MKLLEYLERRLGRFAIANLTILLVAGQFLGFLIGNFDGDAISLWALTGEKVLAGELWRLLLFPIHPPDFSLFFLFGLYLFYLMGMVLEAQWGVVRFNLYIFVGYISTIAIAFLQPEAYITNAYIGTSVFLAFAWLYPDYEILLMLVLPVKVKYLAWLSWILIALSFIYGDTVTKITAIAGVANFFLFFGRELFHIARHGTRTMERAAKRAREQSKPFHRCAICGKTDKTDPYMDFRYCSGCDGSLEYCEEHLRDHEHVHAESQTS